MFSETLKKLRKDNKVTQVQLASHLGFFHSAVVKWENGQCEPSYETLVKIADFFGVTVDHLLGHETKKSVIERPTSDIAENFIRENMELFSEKAFNDLTKLYKVMSDMQKIATISYIVGFLSHSGVDTKPIIGY